MFSRENTSGFNALEGEKFSFSGHCTPDCDRIIEASVFPPFVYVLKGVLHPWTSKCEKLSSFNNNVFKNSRTHYCLTKTVRKGPYLYLNIFKKVPKSVEPIFTHVLTETAILLLGCVCLHMKKSEKIVSSNFRAFLKILKCKYGTFRTVFVKH